jgi:hypothetical protein
MVWTRDLQGRQVDELTDAPATLRSMTWISVMGAAQGVGGSSCTPTRPAARLWLERRATALATAMALKAPTKAAYPSEASCRFEWVTATPAAIAGKLNDR